MLFRELRQLKLSESWWMKAILSKKVCVAMEKAITIKYFLKDIYFVNCLGYCAMTWHLYLQRFTEKLQGMQCLAMRMARLLQHVTYQERLAHLKLFSFM